MSDHKKIEPSYYSIMPANVRYDKRLVPNAKILYSEITCLCNQHGHCWANNSYFANLYDKSNETISRWISDLRKYNYILIKYTYKCDSKEIDNRYISLNLSRPIDENINTPPQQNNHDPIDKNVSTPIDKNVKDNITSSNNTRSFIIIGFDKIYDLKEWFSFNAGIWLEHNKVHYKNVAADVAIEKFFDAKIEYEFKDRNHLRNSFRVFWENLSKEKRDEHVKTGIPIKPDKKFEFDNKHNMEKLQLYWKSLRENGYKSQTIGMVKKWIKV